MKECLGGCGRIVPGTYCPQCTPPRPAYRSEYHSKVHRAARQRIKQGAAGWRVCVWCGAPAEVPDHVIPLSKGGKSVWSNLVPACSACNRKRVNNAD